MKESSKEKEKGQERYVLYHNKSYFTGQTMLPRRRPKIESLTSIPYFSPSKDRAKIYENEEQVKKDIMRYNLAFCKVKKV